jgi:hypothetical protein
LGVRGRLASALRQASALLGARGRQASGLRQASAQVGAQGRQASGLRQASAQVGARGRQASALVKLRGRPASEPADRRILQTLSLACRPAISLTISPAISPAISLAIGWGPLPAMCLRLVRPRMPISRPNTWKPCPTNRALRTLDSRMGSRCALDFQEIHLIARTPLRSSGCREYEKGWPKPASGGSAYCGFLVIFRSMDELEDRHLG